MAEAILEDIEELAGQLSDEDKLYLVEYLAQSLRENHEKKQRKDLYGIYRGLVPDDVDIDAALKEIRHQWEEELPQVLEK